MSGVNLIITITDRENSEEFSAWFRAQDIPLVLTVYGNGTATTEILDCLGLEAKEKSVLFCVTGQPTRLVHKASKELWLDVPGRGLLIAVSVSSIGGAAARNYLLHQEVEEHMEKDLTHELIVVITNQGCTDRVMDAARDAGATGGTSIHAKGTGTALAKKFFGVSIAAEKELVFILTRAETRNQIMKAIIAGAGPQTDANSLVFSLPVSELAGLRQLDSDD